MTLREFSDKYPLRFVVVVVAVGTVLVLVVAGVLTVALS